MILQESNDRNESRADTLAALTNVRSRPVAADDQRLRPDKESDPAPQIQDAPGPCSSRASKSLNLVALIAACACRR